jgi:branched-chain amino acid transport system substrate-binding protein
VVSVAAAMLAPALPALAQTNDQFIALPSYRVGPYGANGQSFYGGFIDYLNYVNLKEGGVNGVKLTWEECETEYNNAKGVECYERLKAKSRRQGHRLSHDVHGHLLRADRQDRRRQGAAGDDGLRPYRCRGWLGLPVRVSAGHDLPDAGLGHRQVPGDEERRIAGRQEDRLPVPRLGLRQGAIVALEAEPSSASSSWSDSVAHPGNEQGAQWLQIRQEKPDYVIFWGWGVMNQTALKAAQKVGFPRDKMIGSWWAGSEEDTVPAGDAAKGYMAPPGTWPARTCR